MTGCTMFSGGHGPAVFRNAGAVVAVGAMLRAAAATVTAAPARAAAGTAFVRSTSPGMRPPAGPSGPI